MARRIADAGVELRWLLVDRTKRARREREQRARAAELETLVAARTAELLQAQATKDRLVATVSHEFRTALSAIGGYAELLAMGLRGPLTEPQAEDVRRIQRAYHHLSHVVDDLLSYSKIISGHLSLHVTDVALRDALRAIAELVMPQAAARHITITLGDTDQSLVVRADTDRLRQIVLNLLGNAIKFVPTQGRIDVRCRADATDVYVDVADNGPGIPPAEREGVFEAFVSHPSPAGVVGTGLGMAISRDLARAMGGDLAIKPQEDGGSCFVLRLPRSTPLATIDCRVEPNTDPGS